MPSTTPSPTATPPKGDKRRVRQAANRALYDRDTLYAILDAAPIGHVAFVHDGWPQSIPTAIARIDDGLWLHGSRSSRLYRVLAAGEPVAVSVCLVDGLVKARSAFHCSMNYRSAVSLRPMTGFTAIAGSVIVTAPRHRSLLDASFPRRHDPPLAAPRATLA